MQTQIPVTDAHSAVLSLVELTKELTSVIDQETDYLDQRRPREAEKFHQIKATLAATYQKELNELGSRGGIQAIGKGEALRTLKQETRKFHVALERNSQKLMAMKTVSENIVQTIGDEINRMNAPAQNYGANAQMAGTKTPKNYKPVTLNKTV